MPSLTSYTDIRLAEHAVEQNRRPGIELFRRRHLRTVRALSLGSNILTNLVTDLPEHLGFSSLDYLDISYGYLSREDLTTLSKAVESRKLPALKTLDISEHKENMDREMYALVQSCLAHYRHRSIKLRHWGYELTTETRTQLKLLEDEI